MKHIFIACFVFCLFMFCAFQVHADSNFATSLTGTYTVSPSGSTHGVFSVRLKNLTDRYYASSYAIQLGFKNITHVTASDIDGILAPQIKQTREGDELSFAFKHRAIGLGAVQAVTFTFDTTDAASKNGNIWEVNIPGLKDQRQFDNFTVTIVVPSSFGSLTYEKPNIGNSLSFTKDQLGQSGISLAFGQGQVYSFKLAYHLKNNQLFPVRMQIALPPDTSYQRISLDSLEPKPLNVTSDPDGNWMAAYALNPGQDVTVYAKGRAFIMLTPQSESLTEQQLQDYLKPTKYWQSNNANIVKLAKQLQTPYAIYEYVVKSLHYDFSRVKDNQERLGAVKVLENPSSAVCLEFTDLFIALARAAGIPAREVDGFAYTQNTRERPISFQKDILHAWPEYYDKTSHTWIMVDPTWENTTGGVDYFHTFDFDHVSFVIKGENPDYPVPAGGYKLPTDKDQAVAVTFATDNDMPVPFTHYDLTVLPTIMGGLNATGDLTIHNTSAVAFSAHHMKVVSTLSTFLPQELLLPEVPPYGTVDIPIVFGKTAFLTNQSGTVTISLAEKKISKNIRIVPFSQLAFIIGGTCIGILSIALFILARRSRRVSIS